MTVTSRRGARRGAAVGRVALLAAAVAACSPSNPTSPPSSVVPTPTATVASSPTGALTETAAPTAPPTPLPSLAALPLTTLGPEPWKLIAAGTNEDGVPHVEVLGVVENGFSWALTCVGSGGADVSMAVSGGTPTLPPDEPSEVFTVTLECPTTHLGSFMTSQFDDRRVAISPHVDPAPGVVYRLIVGTIAD